MLVTYPAFLAFVADDVRGIAADNSVSVVAGTYQVASSSELLAVLASVPVARGIEHFRKRGFHVADEVAFYATVRTVNELAAVAEPIGLPPLSSADIETSYTRAMALVPLRLKGGRPWVCYPS